MLLAALGSLALAPLLDAGARRAAARGGAAGSGLVALDSWIAVVACGVVLLEVMPAGIAELGAVSIAIALLGAVLTSATHHGGGDRWLGVAALVGLAAHSFLDGVAITATAGAAAFGAGLGVTLHNAPAGLAIWRTAGSNGRKALGVAIAATIVGGAVGHLGLLGEHEGTLTPLLTGVQCFVAGSVLHLATHASHGSPSLPRGGAFASALGALVGTMTVAGICVAEPLEAPFAAELSALPTALGLWIEGAPWIFGGLLFLFLLGQRLPAARANAVIGVFAAAAWLGVGVAGVQAIFVAPLLLVGGPQSAEREDVVAGTAPWLLSGLAAASLAEPWMGQELGGIPLGLQLGSAALLHLVLASPVALAPVAALLVHKGADPAVALALTLPTLLAPGAARLGLAAPAARLAGIGVAVALSATVALAPISSALATLNVPDFHAAAAHAHGAVEYACAATVAGLCLAALLRSGLYGFVRTLESEPS